MTRPDPDRVKFLAGQCKRISAWWPSFTPSKEALAELVRNLDGFTEEEIERGFAAVIDTHPEAAAPKPAHLKAAVAAVARVVRRIPETEAERVSRYEAYGMKPPDEAERARRDLEAWCSATPERRAAVERVIDALTANWDAQGKQHRDVMRPTAMRIVREREAENPKLRVVK